MPESQLIIAKLSMYEGREGFSVDPGYQTHPILLYSENEVLMERSWLDSEQLEKASPPAPNNAKTLD
jgi:hypothetical protein